MSDCAKLYVSKNNLMPSMMLDAFTRVIQQKPEVSMSDEFEFFRVRFASSEENKTRTMHVHLDARFAGFQCVCFDLGEDEESIYLLTQLAKITGGILLTESNGHLETFDYSIAGNLEFMLKLAHVEGQLPKYDTATQAQALADFCANKEKQWSGTFKKG